MNKVHKTTEPKPSTPPHHRNNILAIDLEPPDTHRADEIPADSEDQQGIEDTTNSETCNIQHMQVYNDIINSGINYTPFVHKLQAGNDYKKYLLQAKRHFAKESATPPPNVNPLY